MTTIAQSDGTHVGRRDPDARGYFGRFGGRYVPETLVEPIEQLAREYMAVRVDAAFRSACGNCSSITSVVHAAVRSDPFGGGGRRRSHLFET